MRMLLAALALAVAATLPGAARAAQPQTIIESPPHQRIAAFAQDGSRLAWLTPGVTSCNSVTVFLVDNGVRVALPDPHTANVTCRWPVITNGVISPVSLALAGSSVLWTLREPPPAPLQFDYVLGATLTAPRSERRFGEIAHAKQGPGLWLGGVAGDGSTLVYSVASVTYADQIGCLAGGSCAMVVDRSGGGVHRIVGRSDPIVPGTDSSLAVAVSGTSLAVVEATSVDQTTGEPTASPGDQIEVRDVVHGTVQATVTPDEPPQAIALAPHVLATLERTATGLQISWYDPAIGGSPLGTVSVPAGASDLSTTDRLIVFRVGRSIRGIDPTTGKVTHLADAATAPIGLSIDGNRIAWAENIAGRGRIRALTP